jgi:hypothetical protein
MRVRLFVSCQRILKRLSRPVKLPVSVKAPFPVHLVASFQEKTFYFIFYRRRELDFQPTNILLVITKKCVFQRQTVFQRQNWSEVKGTYVSKSSQIKKPQVKIMSSQNQTLEVMIPNIEDLDPSKFIMSEKLVNNWTWKSKDDGSMQKRTQVYANMDYEKKGQKLQFAISDLRTFNGIQISKFKKGFMSVNLSDEQSDEIKSRVDKVIFEKCYENRKSLLKKGGQINHPAEMKMMYEGVVTKGDPKGDGSEDCYQDQITCTVPTKKKGHNVLIDSNLCPVEDLDLEVFDWKSVDGKRLKEVVVEIEKITFDQVIKVRARYRLITIDGKTAPRAMTKRKIQQQEVIAKRSLPTNNYDSELARAEDGDGESVEPSSKKAKVDHQAP